MTITCAWAKRAGLTPISRDEFFLSQIEARYSRPNQVLLTLNRRHSSNGRSSHPSVTSSSQGWSRPQNTRPPAHGVQAD